MISEGTVIDQFCLTRKVKHKRDKTQYEFLCVLKMSVLELPDLLSVMAGAYFMSNQVNVNYPDVLGSHKPT